MLVACGGHASHPAPALSAQPPAAAPDAGAPVPLPSPPLAERAPDRDPPPLVPGKVVVVSSDDCGFILDTVYFPSGSAIAASDATKAVLDATAQLFTCTQKQGQWLKVEVQGHADDREPDPLTLSDSRAAWVRAELVARGVPADWLTTQGYAAGFPIDRRKSAAARAKNRRVMFLIVGRGP